MSLVKLIEFSDRRIREEIGDYYIISEGRIENIRNNLDKLRKDKQELKDVLRELVEAAEWRDECHEMAKCENSFFVFKTSCPTPEDWDRASNADKSFFFIKEAAETAYQAALKAAKEG